MHEPIDLNPDRLTVAFGGSLQPALASSTLPLPTTTVEAAVLSASHQVRTLEGHAIETLACNTGGRVPGPRRVIVHTGVDRWDLAFDYTVDRDECNRPTPTLEGLAKLPPVMGEGKFVTAGNASQLSDGAAAVVLMEASEADRRGPWGTRRQTRTDTLTLR